jgi:alkyldihydroxyacetonephosphate synthase
LGSEGIFGVIVEATVRVRRIPSVSDFRGVMFRDFAGGLSALRALKTARLPMSMARLSDAEETALSLTLSQDPERSVDPKGLFLGGIRALGYGSERCVMLCGMEGDDRAFVSAQMLRAQAICVSHGGLPLGQGPGRKWRAERFRTPYLRDVLLDHSVAIDTMETSFEWRDLERGHHSVVAALEAAAKQHAGAGIAMGHVSHSYPDGACVYFIVIYPLDTAQPIVQWRNIKHAATEAIVQAGGTVSHHHGVGIDHAPWLPRENGELGMQSVAAIKAALDPEGIMNPGKIL